MPNLEQDSSLHQLVREKLTKVFGRSRGDALLRNVMLEVQLESVSTTAELLRVAEALQRRSGFEATTGAMLAVMASIRISQGL